MYRKLLKLFLLFSSLLCAEDVLNDKMSIGVELNPLRLLISDKNWLTVSGTIAHFNNSNGVEIAIPFYYLNENRDNGAYRRKEKRFNLDIHYRQYLFGKETTGLYLGGFGRYTYLDGKAINRLQYVTVNKFGLGGEIGFRLKGQTIPIYWGASLSLGGYLGNSNDKLSRDVMFDGGWDDRKLILDIELLKVGYEF